MALPKENKKAKMTSDANNSSSIVEELPDEIIEKILSHTPLKVCTRAALAAKRSINTWKISRNLCFDVDEQRLPKDAYISLVDRVLDQHSGTKVAKLVLTFDATGQENHVVGWIQKVVAKGVEDLNLDFSSGNQPFPFSSDLIDVTPIRALKLDLDYCEVGFAKKLNGLRSLKTLALENVRLMNKFTDIIFINCLLLENLEIVNCINNSRLQILAGHLKHFKSPKVERCKDLDSIFINAPTLESFRYSGDILMRTSKPL